MGFYYILWYNVKIVSAAALATSSAVPNLQNENYIYNIRVFWSSDRGIAQTNDKSCPRQYT